MERFRKLRRLKPCESSEALALEDDSAFGRRKLLDDINLPSVDRRRVSPLGVLADLVELAGSLDFRKPNDADTPKLTFDHRLECFSWEPSGPSSVVLTLPLPLLNFLKIRLPCRPLSLPSSFRDSRKNRLPRRFFIGPLAVVELLAGVLDLHSDGGDPESDMAHSLPTAVDVVARVAASELTGVAFTRASVEAVTSASSGAWAREVSEFAGQDTGWSTLCGDAPSMSPLGKGSLNSGFSEADAGLSLIWGAFSPACMERRELGVSTDEATGATAESVWSAVSVRTCAACKQHGSSILAWLGAAQTHLVRLDRVQQKAMKLVGPGTLLQSLSLRRMVAATTYLYKLHYTADPPQLTQLLPHAAAPHPNPYTRLQLKAHHQFQLLNPYHGTLLITSRGHFRTQ